MQNKSPVNETKRTFVVRHKVEYFDVKDFDPEKLQSKNYFNLNAAKQVTNAFNQKSYQTPNDNLFNTCSKRSKILSHYINHKK